MITYRDDPTGLTEADFAGFYGDWSSPPAHRLRVVTGAQHTVLAFDDDRLIGFITGLSDGVTFAFIPMLEVLGPYQGRGIGTALVERLLEAFGPIYAVDLVCDERLVGFYERLGMQPMRAMSIRRRS